MKRLMLAILFLLAPNIWAQTYTVTPTPRQQFFSEVTGLPLSSGKLCTYASGTTTPVPTYKDVNGSAQNPNPIVLDARGMATIFIEVGVSYKFTLYDNTGTPGVCNGNQQWTVDGISSTGGSSVQLGNGTTVLDATTFTGSTWDAKVQAAIAACPATGCIIDTRGLAGAQSMATSVSFGGTPQPMTIILAPGLTLTRASGAQLLMKANARLIGQGKASSTITGNDTSAAIVGVYAGSVPSYLEVANLQVQNSGIGPCVDFLFSSAGALSSKVHDNQFACATGVAFTGYYNYIYRNTFGASLNGVFWAGTLGDTQGGGQPNANHIYDNVYVPGGHGTGDFIRGGYSDKYTGVQDYEGPSLAFFDSGQAIQFHIGGDMENVFCNGRDTWASTTAYGRGAVIADSNGNCELNVTPSSSSYTATSGGSTPSWPSTVGNTTVDGGVTWLMYSGNSGESAFGLIAAGARGAVIDGPVGQNPYISDLDWIVNGFTTNQINTQSNLAWGTSGTAPYQVQAGHLGVQFNYSSASQPGLFSGLGSINASPMVPLSGPGSIANGVALDMNSSSAFCTTFGYCGRQNLRLGTLLPVAGINSQGPVNFSALPNPAAPTLTAVGTTGSTSLTYYLVAHVNGGVTLPSVSATISNANATLNSSNYVNIKIPTVIGSSVDPWSDATWDILKGNTSTSLATGVRIGPNGYNDQGGSTSAYSAPSRNTTGDITLASSTNNTGAVSNVCVDASNIIVTCGSPVGSGTNVSVNGGSVLTTMNLNSASPSADSGFLPATFKNSSANTIAEIPWPESGATCYAAPTAWGGNDANDGLTWATPKASIMSCYDMIPNSGGTIFFTGNDSNPVAACKATDPAGCGIWLMGSGDPNYGSPPSGWRHSKTAVNFIGVGGTGTSFAQGAQVLMTAGNGTYPAMWLSDLYGHRFQNIKIQYPKQGILLGVDSNGSSNNVATSSWDDLFDNISVHINQSAGNGPGVLIGTNSFWDTFNNSQFQGNSAEVSHLSTCTRTSALTTCTAAATLPSSWTTTVQIAISGATPSTFNTGPVTATVTGSTTFTFPQNLPDDSTGTGGYASSDAAQNVLLNPAGGAGVGEIVFQHPFVSVTGIRSYNGSGTNFVADNIYQENGEAPAIEMSGCPGQSIINYVYPADIVATGLPGVRTPNCGTLTINSALVNGTATGMNIQPGKTTVLPSYYGQGAIVGQRVFGHITAPKRAFTPVVSRFTNLARQDATTWNTGGCGTATISLVAAPDGSTLAGEATTGSTNTACFRNYSVTPAVGDVVVFGAWVRSATGNGYHASAVQIACGTCKVQTGLPYIYSASLGNTVSTTTAGSLGGTGEWQWVQNTGFVIQATGSSTVMQFYGNVDSTHTADFYAPVMIYLPVGTYVDDELAEIAQNLQTYRDDTNPGVVSILKGQSFQADNYSEYFTAGSGGVTAQNLVQLDASAPSKIVATTTGVYGVALNTASANNPVQVARLGFANVLTDTGGCTAGHYALIGTSTVTYVKDGGTSRSLIPITTRIVGVCRTTATAGNAALVELEPNSYGTMTASAFGSTAWVGSGTMTWALASASVANTSISATHNTSSTLNITNPVNGGFYTITVLQDATGGGTTTLNLGTGCSAWYVSNGTDYATASSVTVTSTASHADILSFTYDGTNCWASYH